MRISDWGSGVCSSDLRIGRHRSARGRHAPARPRTREPGRRAMRMDRRARRDRGAGDADREVQRVEIAAPHIEAAAMIVARGDHRGAFVARSEEHTSELQYLMRISYAVFCLKNKTY